MVGRKGAGEKDRWMRKDWYSMEHLSMIVFWGCFQNLGSDFPEIPADESTKRGVGQMGSMHVQS